MSLLGRALTLLAAPQCVWCHLPTTWDQTVCPACEASFRSLSAAHPRHPVTAGLDDLWSALPYEEPVRSWIARVKTGRSVLAAQALGQRMAAAYRPQPDDSSAHRWIVPIPLPARRWVTRGFNQAHLLAQSLAHCHGGRMCTVLRTSAMRSSLSSQNKRKRLDSDHRFSLGDTSGLGEPATIWLVDDVVTNGTTLERAAAVMRARWPRARLYGITLARTPPL